MCAYQSAKKSFSREEIIEILKKNVELYKNDSNFPNYIVDLTLYLVEYAYKREEPQAIFIEPGLDIVTQGSQKIYKVFRPPTGSEAAKICPFCGARVRTPGGVCDQCGNLV